MEQQNKPASTSPFTDQVPPQHPQRQQDHHEYHRRDTRDTPSSPRASTSPSHPQPDDPLSTSEYSLRFPCPSGSRHLANWISTSDPDIMRLTSRPTEDAGLSNSTYELISGTDDSESWSQDGNDREDISESVSSLDPRRPDDVQSLADTEQMTDDELPSMPTQLSSNYAPFPAEENPWRHIKPQAFEDPDSGSEEESASRSSLEYTQQSLGTPSMNTPEASKVYERLPEMHPTLEWLNKIYTGVCARVRDHKEYLRRGLEDGTMSVAHPTIAVLVVIQVIIFGLTIQSAIGLMTNMRTKVDQASAAPTVTTTVTAFPQLHTSTTSTSPSRSLATAHSSTGLTLRDDESSVEWLFGPKKPEVSFSTQSNNAFLAHVPDEVKKAWVSNDCVTFTASRDGELIQTTTTSVREGLLVRFPRRETHGIVDLTLEATCKPSLRKVVKVRFVKGILEEAFELTKHVAKDLVPAAERGLVEFKKAMEPARDSFRKYSQTLPNILNVNDLVVMKNEMMDLIQTRHHDLRTELHRTLEGFKGTQKHAADLAHDAQTKLQLGLLNAQISAKLSWLSLLGKTEERDEYKQKAAIFMSDKEAAARRGRSRHAEHARSLWWS